MFADIQTSIRSALLREMRELHGQSASSIKRPGCLLLPEILSSISLGGLPALPITDFRKAVVRKKKKGVKQVGQ